MKLLKNSNEGVGEGAEKKRDLTKTALSPIIIMTD